MKKHNSLRESLAARLTAYSILAGAALAFMPDANAALVSSRGESVVRMPLPVSEMLIQNQQVQSQKVRHKHQRSRRKNLAKIHVLSGGSGSSSSSCSCSSSTTSCSTPSNSGVE